LEAEQAIEGLINVSGIPQKLLGHTKAIVVFPNLVKAAMIAGARVGKGVVIVRSPKTGKWNPPAFIKSRQASWGIQAGIQRAELVLLVMTKKGLKQRGRLFPPTSKRITSITSNRFPTATCLWDMKESRFLNLDRLFFKE